MTHQHSWRVSYKSYSDGKLEKIVYFCDGCKEFDEVSAEGEIARRASYGKIDPELERVVANGKAHGKNINKLRSEYKNGKWRYKYLD